MTMLPVCAGDGEHTLVEVGTPNFEGPGAFVYEHAVTIRSNNPGSLGGCLSVPIFRLS